MPSFKALLKQSVQVENPSGARDKQGRDAFGAATTLAARAQRTRKVIVTATNDREPIDLIVFLAKTATISDSSRITYDGEKFRVMKCEGIPGRNGQIHHYEIMAQLWSYKAGS